MKRHLLFKSLLLLCALIVGSTSVWAATAHKTGSWDLTTSSSDWTSSNCETYFSQPYGMKKANAYIMNKAISDFSTENITSIKIGVKSLRNGATTSVLTVYLVDKDGAVVGSGLTITPVNASSASSTTYQYVTFESGFSGVTGFQVKCTTFGKNVLVNGASYDVSYTAPDVAVTGVSLPSTAEVGKGKTTTLVPTFIPAGATNKNVTWESDNESIATVSDAGVVTGVAYGKANITVTTEEGGFTATCEVTVDDGSINLANTGIISFTTFNGDVLGSGSYQADKDCDLTASNGKTYTWNEKNGYYNNSGWQIKSGGKVTSPTIKSSNGFTITVTHSTGNNVTISDGTNSGTNTFTTTKTSTTITLQGSGGYTVISGIYITPTLPGPTDPTTSGNVTYLTTSDNMAGWRAFYDEDNSYRVDGSTTVYVADADPSGDVITLKAIEGIPANVPVILHTSSIDDSHKMTLTKETDSPFSYTGTNKLIWATTLQTNVYRLGYGASGVGFYPYSGTPASGAVILNVSSASARELTIDVNDDVTGIRQIENGELRIDNSFYNLNGQKVQNPSKGLYIMNGKKVILK